MSVALNTDAPRSPSTRGLVLSIRRRLTRIRRVRVVTRGAEILGAVLWLGGRCRWHARMRVVTVRVGVRIRGAVLWLGSRRRWCKVIWLQQLAILLSGPRSVQCFFTATARTGRSEYR
jgi:hypothetical protein